jgi:hypothetical protein
MANVTGGPAVRCRHPLTTAGNLFGNRVPAVAETAHPVVKGL